MAPSEFDAVNGVSRPLLLVSLGPSETCCANIRADQLVVETNYRQFDRGAAPHDSLKGLRFIGIRRCVGSGPSLALSANARRLSSSFERASMCERIHIAAGIRGTAIIRVPLKGIGAGIASAFINGGDDFTVPAWTPRQKPAPGGSIGEASTAPRIAKIAISRPGSIGVLVDNPGVSFAPWMQDSDFNPRLHSLTTPPQALSARNWSSKDGCLTTLLLRGVHVHASLAHREGLSVPRRVAL